MRIKLLKGIFLMTPIVLAAGIYWKLAKPAEPVQPAMSPMTTHGSGPAGGIQNPHQEEMLIQALKKMPNHTPVLMKLAELEAAAGNLQAAAGHLRTILNADPDNPDANLELGKILFELGDVQGAIQHTAAILSNHPTHEDALYNLGAIYANIGSKKNAAAYWKRLSALNSHSERVQRAQLLINRLEAGNP